MPDVFREPFDYIDAHSQSFLRRLEEFLAQPCVVATGEGIDESAKLVSDLLKNLGASFQSLVAGSSPPAIFARLRGKSAASLLFYNHYDVQPADPLEEWTTPPFRPDIRDGRIFARGVADNRGDFLARLFAVEAVLATAGQLPLEIKFFCEGEEEIGSPHLAEIVSQHTNLLRSDGCLWESGSRSASGRFQIFLGLKGMCAAEIRIKGAASDLHSSNATLVPSPAWRLVRALDSLKDPSGRILIPAFYGDVSPPSDEDLALLENIPFDADAMKARWGVQALVAGLSGRAALRAHIFEPTCNICGLTSGYQGPGVKTVLPNVASAKLDFRLVPNQHPDRVLELLRTHLDRAGFADAQIIPEGGLLPARTSPDAAISRATVAAAAAVYSHDPVVFPSMAASGPMSLFTRELSTPTASAGVANDRSNIHAPDENILVEDFISGIKYAVALMYDMARVVT